MAPEKGEEKMRSRVIVRVLALGGLCILVGILGRAQLASSQAGAQDWKINSVNACLDDNYVLMVPNPTFGQLPSTLGT